VVDTTIASWDGRPCSVVRTSDYQVLAARLAEAERLLRAVLNADESEDYSHDGVWHEVRAFLATADSASACPRCFDFDGGNYRCPEHGGAASVTVSEVSK
jgi:hypothetical protein